ncbi:MAG TPA: radical SAM protein, partial [Deltaproteobacteria bacterium]|nr:radical SAM protein [Deltaproteobacteria bacterium]
MNAASSLLRFFLDTGIRRRRIPLIASFKLTYRCNLACRGCPFHSRADRKHAHMDFFTARRCLDALRYLGCRIVIFEGGEPLLWKDDEYSFRDLVQLARRSFLCVGATTNGTLPLDAPTDVLWVSIDGLKATHDDLRSGSYDRVISNIRSSRHPKLFVHYTLNSRNFREFPAAVDALCSLERVRGITVQLFYPYGQGEENLRLSQEERREALATAAKLKRLGYPILNSSWSLRAMIHNRWRCRDWLLANVEPDGTIFTGCYVKNRG